MKFVKTIFNECGKLKTEQTHLESQMKAIKRINEKNVNMKVTQLHKKKQKT